MTPTSAANLLRLAGWGFILFGIIFVTIAFPAFDGLAHIIADLFDWTGPPHEETLSRDARWFGAIFSGLSVGFGAAFTFIIAPLLTLPSLQARKIGKHGGLISAFGWYVVDSAGSFAAGVPSNVVLNTIFLIALTLPLFLLKPSAVSSDLRQA